MRGATVGLVAGALAIALSGCSACVGSGCTTSGKDLAKEAQTQFNKVAEARGRPPLPPITCPHDIKNETGATTRCFAKGNFGGGLNGTLAITVTVTSVTGSTVNFHFDSDGQVQPSGGRVSA